MSIDREQPPTPKIVKLRKFIPFEGEESFSEEFKQRLLDSDSCLIPILLDESTPTIEAGTVEARKVYLVHLQIRKMIVTVYTSEEYGHDGEKAVASQNSDEMADTADEIIDSQKRLSDLPTTSTALLNENGGDLSTSSRRNTTKLPQLGSFAEQTLLSAEKAIE